jgi:hypothetical protein
MLLLLMFIRTAIGILAAVLAWFVLVRFVPVPADLKPLVIPFASGFFGGLACMSLTPAQGLPIAATCGVILCIVTGVPQGGSGAWNVWSLVLIPGYLSGAAAWLAIARTIQRR